MTATAPSPAHVDAKAGWCNFCRGDSHGLCASAGCRCPDRRRHPRRPPAQRGQAKPVRPSADDRAAALIEKARNGSPPPVADKPRFRLVRKDPPQAVRKLGLSDHLLPLLDDIPQDSEEWWSVAECPTARGAAVMCGRCRKLGVPGWEWKAGDNEVFVRRHRGSP